jgi:hypothetical protein
MHQKYRCKTKAGVVVATALLLVWPANSVAGLGSSRRAAAASTSSPTVVGTASAVNATTAGALGVLSSLGLANTTMLANTGTLSGPNDARDAFLTVGSIPSLLTAEVLNASSFSYPNEVDSQASLANLGLSVAGVTIFADSVVAQASQLAGAAGTGASSISNLSINGIPVTVSGYPNQTVPIPGGQVILNEQSISSTGSAVVNAIHVTVNGVADVVIASATAGIS